MKDESVSLMLHDIIPPDGFDICNTQTLPGVAADKVSANLQVMVNLGREGGGGGGGGVMSASSFGLFKVTMRFLIRP